MNILVWIFWGAAGVVAYTFVLYPLLAGLLARFLGRPLERSATLPRSVSIVIAACNEAGRIRQRLEELLGVLKVEGIEGEIVVVSDGSTDGTPEIARGVSAELIRVLEQPARRGKAAALSAGCALATGEVLVFADVRQSWQPGVLATLLENFQDPQVGAVSGDLVLESAPGVLAGVGLYWRFEKWLRRQESRFWSQVGATGAISAVRRALFRPIPDGTILDDVWWPLHVAMRGYRVVHDPRAQAFDRLPPRAADEFRRKVRTLTGNFQLAARLPAALLPWRNPIWLQLVSHKLLRLVVPWCLLGMLAASALLPGEPYLTALVCQLAGYGLGLLGLWPATRRVPLASAAASFLLLNGAAFVAFWMWLLGREGRTWTKVEYTRPASSLPDRAPAPV
jgi:cellulose synthase/poly-beta-1,6-N-acetylglucosamine synthase-like glycosyltransferase